jgi:UDP-glucuronate 4-epimerase
LSPRSPISASGWPWLDGLRFFTGYGHWGRPDMAPMLFARAILAGEPIKVFNQGQIQRAFTDIDGDIAEG